MLSADDVAESVAHILSARPEALISRVELRPARPQRG
jgi:NADP-dependent 3-hydroxy acid dehydrogenase YdfG